MAQKARIEEYADGNVAIYNLRNNIGVPVFGLNEMISASRVTEYWDGTPMDDSKVDNQLYIQLKELPDDSNPELEKYIGDYFKVNLPYDGELFLQKSSVGQVNNMSPVEISLLRMGYYKGVMLNGYYEEGDTPAPIEYYLSDTTEEDDGGSVIEVGEVKLIHDFIGDVNVKYFGATSDNILFDNYTIFKRIFEYISSTNGGSVFFPVGTYYFKSIKDEILHTFLDLESLNIYGDGAIIEDTQVFDREVREESDFVEIHSSKNLKIGRGITFISQTYDVEIGPAYSGIRWFIFKKGCSNIEINTEFYGCRGGVSFDRELSTNPDSDISHNISCNIKASYSRYPYLSRWSGHNAVVNLETTRCGRPFFLYGVKNNTLNVIGNNDVATSLIKTYEGVGNFNVDIYYEDLYSTIETTQSGEKIGIHFGDEQPTVMRDITIKLNVANYYLGWGHTISVDKFVGGGTTPDVVGRGHILENLTITGYSKGYSGVNHVTTARGELRSPDKVINFKEVDFLMDDAGSHNISLYDSVEGNLSFENVSIRHSNLAVVNRSGKVIFNKCQALNFTPTVAEHKLINCEVIDGTVQGYGKDKEFENTSTPIGLFTRKNKDSLFGNPKSTIVTRDSLENGLNVFKLNTNSSGVFRLTYFLIKSTGQTNPALRAEKYGIKTWSSTVVSTGMTSIQMPIVDEIPERTLNDFSEDLIVTIVDGDSSGYYVNIECDGILGGTSVAVLTLELLSHNDKCNIEALV